MVMPENFSDTAAKIVTTPVGRATSRACPIRRLPSPTAKRSGAAATTTIAPSTSTPLSRTA